MLPFIHTFWSHPFGQYGVRTTTGTGGWQFPPGAFSSPILTLPDWYGPWPRINQAYWRSECGTDSLTPAVVGVQLVAMTYDISTPQVLCELTNLCQPNNVYSREYNRNVTDVLKPVFAAAVPERNNAIQIGVRIMAAPGTIGRVNSSRLMIAFAP